MSHLDAELQEIRAYYGRTLTGKRDLRTNACCCRESVPTPYQSILSMIDGEILDRFYGCGSPIPPALEGCTVLDLGCGSGRDAYLISALVGPRGKVIGVDMTEEQLQVARRHQHAQALRFGYAWPNTDFRQGFIEDLAALGIADNSIDVVVSNCVINLSPAQPRVFTEIFRVLKPGGELLCADVFADRRLPARLREDPELRAECLGGAMYVEDLRRLLRDTGWPDYRVVSRSRISIGNPTLENRVAPARFWSIKLRAFKLPSLEDICEDYGQAVTYLGTIPDHPQRFALDDHHTFLTGRPMRVCGNTATMVGETRLARHFNVEGDRSCHFGRFDCGCAPEGVESCGCC
ncbi:Arsenite methyltransferase [Rhodovastum atsumiense]|uniref:Arsenite methyltransferase n=1 Tax=Rhodovastum atsumiense TaxID=504468 RepID=A0A5M6IPC8_9PROT|nr:methyltransferase domain-containing protein [Rhodovastum atsumiense]KAA5609418.1 methyltransferase domain-containing protein [Rhodovastum atsumiense]CAH2601821.1 Arsenite methyltransferase [Rhodovastum atsumiense]